MQQHLTDALGPGPSHGRKGDPPQRTPVACSFTHPGYPMQACARIRQQHHDTGRGSKHRWSQRAGHGLCRMPAVAHRRASCALALLQAPGRCVHARVMPDDAQCCTMQSIHGGASQGALSPHVDCGAASTLQGSARRARCQPRCSGHRLHQPAAGSCVVGCNLVLDVS